MRTERLYLVDILDAADAIVKFLSAVTMDAFLGDDILQSAVLQKLIVVGEAAAHLSDEFRDRHPEIEWQDIVGLRNIAVHAYFTIDWSIIWYTATEGVPDLRRKIAVIVDADK